MTRLDDIRERVAVALEVNETFARLSERRLSVAQSDREWLLAELDRSNADLVEQVRLAATCEAALSRINPRRRA